MIYTFYSFKGGVGRSMALANIAECFYLQGLRVVIIDWDLEAPGLESFFFDHVQQPTSGTPATLEGAALVQSRLGLIDLLTEYKRSYSLLAPALVTPVEEWAPKSFRERIAEDLRMDVGQTLSYTQRLDEHLSLATYLFPIHERDTNGGELWLLPAGWRHGDRFEAYAEAVQSFHWEDFYVSFRGKEFFDWMRARLLARADVVLIDSRTGVTEMGGVCARQLADVVVSFCAPNRQNVEGVTKMVKSFRRPETIKARSHRPLETIVIPTRVDPQEVQKLDEFLAQFVALVDEAQEAPKAFSEVGTRYWDLRIPYRTVYSYEERRVIGRGIKDLDPTRGLETAYRSLAAHLALLAEEGSVIRSRFADDLQQHFPSLMPKVAVLCDAGAEARGQDLRNLLSEAKIRVWPETADLTQWTSAMTHVIHAVIVTSESPDLTAMRNYVRAASQLGVWVHIVGPSSQWPIPNWLKGAAVYHVPGRELLGGLRSRVAAVRAPMMAPPLPSTFVQRRELENRLKELLLGGTDSRTPSAYAVWGGPGVGKSVVTAAVVRDDAIAESYHDGVFWVSASDPAPISQLYAALTGETSTSEITAPRVNELLRGRRALLVIDDAWNDRDVDPLLRLGDRVTRVVVTRNLDVATAVTQQIVTVGEMTRDEASRLLTGSIEGNTLATELECWPLAISLARSALDQQLARQRTVAEALEDLKKKLDRHGILAFDVMGGGGISAGAEGQREKEDRRHSTIAYEVSEKKEVPAASVRNQSVAVSVEATLELLAVWQRGRLQQLVQLSKGKPVDFDALSQEWDKRAPEQGEPRRFDTRERQKLLQTLSAVSLIEWKSQDEPIQLSTSYRRVLEAQGVIGDAAPHFAKRRVSSASDRQSNTDVERVRRILGGQDVTYAESLELFSRLKAARYFGYARQLMSRIRSMPAAADRRLWTAQQLALCTYKDPDLASDLRATQALAILEDADPLQKTTDQETLGLAGAVFKYWFKASGQVSRLERSSAYYLRGYEQGIHFDWGYTAINAAFVLDLLAIHEEREAKRAGTSSATAQERRTLAKRIRNELADRLPSLARDPGNAWLEKQWWFLMTIAEAHFGLGRHEEARFWLREAMSLDVAEWEFESSARQFAELAWCQNDGAPPQPGSAASITLQLFLGNDATAVESVTTGKVGLALSGGGFRASLFHIGVLARLAELDLLRRVEVLSCVSGGSIVGAHYYLQIRKLLQEKTDEEVTREDYVKVVQRLERDFVAGVQRNLRTRLYANPWVSLKCLLSPRYNRTDRLGELYESEFFSRVETRKDWPLRDLTIKPRGGFDDFAPKLDNWRRTNKVPVLVLNATALNTGHNWQFTATWMGEPPPGVGAEVDTNDQLRRMYYWEAPRSHQAIALGRAVAASACVPGLFDPVVMNRLYPNREVRLVDGGVHDNQGISALIEQECSVMLVSDASGQMESQLAPSGRRFQALLRASSISMARVREMEFRDVDSRYRSSQIRGLVFLHLKKGLEAQPIDWIGCIDPFDVSADAKPGQARGPLTSYGIPKEIQARLAGLRTDLDSFSDLEADALMYSGYRMAAARMDEGLPGITLPAASGTADWRFLSIERTINKAKDFEAAHDDLMKILSVGRSNAWKIWRLGGIQWLLLGLCAAVIAVNLSLRDTLEVLLWVGGSPYFIAVLGAEVALIIGTMVWLVGFGLQAIGWRRPWTKTAAAAIMALFGWIPWALHQHVVEPLFLLRGTRRSEAPAKTVRGLWKPVTVGALLLLLTIEPFVTRLMSRSQARSTANTFLRERQWQEAVVALDRVIELDPRDAQARIGRAWANRELGQYFQATSDNDLAYTALNCGRFTSARILQRALSESDKSTVTICVRVLRDRAYTKRLAGLLDEAASDEEVAQELLKY